MKLGIKGSSLRSLLTQSEVAICGGRDRFTDIFPYVENGRRIADLKVLGDYGFNVLESCERCNSFAIITVSKLPGLKSASFAS
jgi:hypothetical protein